jgi:hypothetical protein
VADILIEGVSYPEEKMEVCSIDFHLLFWIKNNFNEDMSGWDVSCGSNCGSADRSFGFGNTARAAMA